MTEPATYAVDELGTAFHSGDPDAVLALFADTGEVVYTGSEPGEVAVGRAAFATLLDDLFAREERYCWRAVSVAAVEDAGRLYVVAECDLTVHPIGPGNRTGPATERAPYRISGVLEQQGSAWRWRLCHGSEPSGS
jgi:hypothetical protein